MSDSTYLWSKTFLKQQKIVHIILLSLWVTYKKSQWHQYSRLITWDVLCNYTSPGPVRLFPWWRISGECIDNFSWKKETYITKFMLANKSGMSNSNSEIFGGCRHKSNFNWLHVDGTEDLYCKRVNKIGI